MEEAGGDEVECDADDVEDGEAVHVEHGGGEGGHEQAEREQEVADEGEAGAVARQARLGRHQLRGAISTDYTLLGVQSWVRFCRQEFGEFPRLVGRYCSYLLPKQAGGTPQILVDKTSAMSGRLRV